MGDTSVASDKLLQGVRQAISSITTIIGPHEQTEKDPSLTYLTFLLSNGKTLLAHQGGQSLWYSTYKSRCPERNTCESFNETCEAVSKSGFVNHLLFSSEPISGENIWQRMDSGNIILVDDAMKIHRDSIVDTRGGQ